MADDFDQYKRPAQAQTDDFSQFKRNAGDSSQQSGVSRFLQSAGLPTHIGGWDDAKAGMKALLMPEESPTDPSMFHLQKLPIVGPLFRAQRETYDQPGIAGKAYGSIPVVGPVGYRMGKQLESGDYAGAAGSGLNIAGQMAGVKGTNLAPNLGTMADTAGTALTKAAPYVGKAAGYGAAGAGAFKSLENGNITGAVMSTIAEHPVERATTALTSGTGKGLKAVGSAMNPPTPEAFGVKSAFLKSPGIEGDAPIPEYLASQVQAKPSIASPKAEPKLPNATYLRDDIRSQTQQPPVTPRPERLLQSLREWDLTRRVNDEMNAQIGSPEEENVQAFIKAHDWKGAGAKPSIAGPTTSPPAAKFNDPAPLPEALKVAGPDKPAINVRPDPIARQPLTQRGTVPQGQTARTLGREGEYALQETKNTPPVEIGSTEWTPERMQQQIDAIKAQKARAARNGR